MRRAEASRELSRLEYDRRVKLYGSAVIAKEELDTSRTTHARDKQQVRELEAKLATGKLPSRIDQIRAAADAVDAARAMVAQARWNLDQMRQSALVGGLVYDLLHYRGEWTAAGQPGGGAVARRQRQGPLRPRPWPGALSPASLSAWPGTAAARRLRPPSATSRPRWNTPRRSFTARGFGKSSWSWWRRP